MTRTPIALFAATALLSACSTDLDLLAPYEDHTVVYGLLNMRDSVQFIKINKAFLGEGNALDHAQVPDSNEYGDEAFGHLWVHKVVNGQRVATFPLQDTTMTGRDPGPFNNPEHKLYYFRDPGTYNVNSDVVYLDASAQYELDLHVKGKTVSAITPIVDDFNFFSTLQNPGTTVQFMGVQGGYGSFRVRWLSGRDGKRYVGQYEFIYDEIRGQDTVRKSFLQGIGSRVSANSQVVGEELEVQVSGEQFFANVASRIPNDPTVDRRIFRGLVFHFTVANDDFHTFLSLSEPVSGIVEERPEYSNIDGAYGIWGSRYTKATPVKRLHVNSMAELQDGPFTAHLRFCSGFAEDGAYFCN
jgi:hypothetical protein